MGFTQWFLLILQRLIKALWEFMSFLKHCGDRNLIWIILVVSPNYPQCPIIKVCLVQTDSGFLRQYLSSVFQSLFIPAVRPSEILGFQSVIHFMMLCWIIYNIWSSSCSPLIRLQGPNWALIHGFLHIGCKPSKIVFVYESRDRCLTICCERRWDAHVKTLNGT